MTSTMNLNIFEFLDLKADPVYLQLDALTEQAAVNIQGFTVRRDKFFEIENDEIHIGFKDKMSCYHFLSDAIVRSDYSE